MSERELYSKDLARAVSVDRAAASVERSASVQSVQRAAVARSHSTYSTYSRSRGVRVQAPAEQGMQDVINRLLCAVQSRNTGVGAGGLASDTPTSAPQPNFLILPIIVDSGTIIFTFLYLYIHSTCSNLFYSCIVVTDPSKFFK